MAISRADVVHVAKLAELELTEPELGRFGDQLNAILEAVGKVSELDLADIPPTSHPLAVVNVVRSDEPRRSLSLEDVFANAPEREDDFFRVPPSARND
jgi:aspartyl-tRNA(Asn)/glutamyl-tRNA(Gln) amidotransferase subunit C